MISVQALKRRLAETTAVGEWFDVGRVDRLEWRSGPKLRSVVAVEWSYSKDELILRVMRKVIVTVGGQRQPRWTKVGQLRVLSRSEAKDLEAWDVLVKDAVRAATVGEVVPVEVPAKAIELHDAADPNESDTRKVYE